MQLKVHFNVHVFHDSAFFLFILLVIIWPILVSRSIEFHLAGSRGPLRPCKQGCCYMMCGNKNRDSDLWSCMCSIFPMTILTDFIESILSAFKLLTLLHVYAILAFPNRNYGQIRSYLVPLEFFHQDSCPFANRIWFL